MAQIVQQCSCGARLSWRNDRRYSSGVDELTDCIVATHAVEGLEGCDRTIFWGYANVNDGASRRLVAEWVERLHEQQPRGEETYVIEQPSPSRGGIGFKTGVDVSSPQYPKLGDVMDALDRGGSFDRMTIRRMVDRLDGDDRPTRIMPDAINKAWRGVRVSGADPRPEEAPENAEACSCGGWTWWVFDGEAQTATVKHKRDGITDVRVFETRGTVDPALVAKRMREWLIEIHATGGETGVADVSMPNELRNKRVCVTGKIAGYTRDGIGQAIAKLGGSMVAKVDQNTHYLVVGDTGDRPPTIKLKDARAWGVMEKDAAWLTELINNWNARVRLQLLAEQQAQAAEDARERERERVQQTIAADLVKRQRDAAKLDANQRATGMMMVDSQGRVVPIPANADVSIERDGRPAIVYDDKGQAIGSIAGRLITPPAPTFAPTFTDRTLLITAEYVDLTIDQDFNITIDLTRTPIGKPLSSRTLALATGLDQTFIKTDGERADGDFLRIPGADARMGIVADILTAYGVPVAEAGAIDRAVDRWYADRTRGSATIRTQNAPDDDPALRAARAIEARRAAQPPRPERERRERREGRDRDW